MPEYLEFRCCMCPNVDNQDCKVCPTTPPKPCRFVKAYIDERGWKFFVRPGLGFKTFKTFYLKPGKTGGGHGYRGTEWRDSFDAAQSDLNAIAKKKGWKEV